MATLPEVAETRVHSCQCNINERLESNLGQFLLTESAESTHHSPAKPGGVSTPLTRTEVETAPLNAYGPMPQGTGRVCTVELEYRGHRCDDTPRRQ